MQNFGLGMEDELDWSNNLACFFSEKVMVIGRYSPSKRLMKKLARAEDSQRRNLHNYGLQWGTRIPAFIPVSQIFKGPKRRAYSCPSSAMSILSWNYRV